MHTPVTCTLLDLRVPFGRLPDRSRCFYATPARKQLSASLFGRLLDRSTCFYAARKTTGCGSGEVGEKSVLLPAMARIFIAQTKIDAWMSAGRVHLDQTTLRLPVGSGSLILGIEAAVFVERIDGGDPDELKLLGKVRTAREVTAVQGELFGTSMVVGDYSYTVRPGFLATYRSVPGQPPQLDPATWARLRTALVALG